MNTQEILNNNSLTKTEKIRQLLALGLTRREVADLTGGNYGFVQNVFARYWPERVQSRIQRAAERATAFTFPAFDRRFGVEIEAYNVDRHVLANALSAAGISVEVEGYNHTTRRHWKIVTDASLNGQQAFELVSPILEGQAGLDEVKTVCRVLKQKNAYINRSCGLHVHFDASGMGLEQLKNMIVNYANYERVIDRFMPQSRRDNYYCKSVRTLASRVEIARTINGLVSLQGDRYEKVNLQSYSRHRTVEFRQHSGTIEFSKISNWILFLHNLVEMSKTQRIDQQTANEASLQAFQQPEIVTYIHNRISELAA
ncbi:amidoligase family protein [Larkinella sp. GY13]|uniref:amidoligase family protein n=1 Tax=Larkinella sp. GY13 TaxID=3453720 RepID=UPI003EEADD92